MRERIVRRMEQQLGKPVADNIEVEETMTPSDIEGNTGSTHGSLYGISSNRRLSAFYRHPNRSRRHRGLYFCGGSAHPGGGMPLAVLSGRIAAQLVERYAVH
jgi:phytoene dehydrogenase-like protein